MSASGNDDSLIQRQRDVYSVFLHETPLFVPIIHMVLMYNDTNVCDFAGYTSLNSDGQSSVCDVLDQLRSWTTCGHRTLLQMHPSSSMDHYAHMSFLAAAWKQIFHGDARPVVILTHDVFFPSTELLQLRGLIVMEHTRVPLESECDVVFCSFDREYCEVIAAGARTNAWSLVLMDGVPLKSDKELVVDRAFQQEHSYLIDALVESRIRVVMWGNDGRHTS